MPLVNRTSKALSHWLSPAFNADLELRPDLDAVEALSSERDALWTRLEAASFLTDDEKRAAIGYPAKPPERAQKYNDNHDELGRFTTADGAVTGPGHALGDGQKPQGSNDGRVRVAQAESDNPRARIGGNGLPVESGTFLGRAGAFVGRYVFGPFGALISMTEPVGNGDFIPAYAGKKSEGVLETAEGDYYLKSGREGPASKMGGKGSGFDNYTKTHVEGHAAALMHQLGLTEARVYVNNPRICTPCTKLLPRMLPPGAKLEVVTPNGLQTFAGRVLP